MKNWLIYALGGGWGHIHRALSLARIASFQVNVQIIANSPYLNYIKEDIPFIHPISHTLDFHHTCEEVRNFLYHHPYDTLIIDTFPRGLGGELADILPHLVTPKILIHRDIHPDYVTAKNLRRFVSENFHRIIIPGEKNHLAFADLNHVYHTAPWLIRSHQELPAKQTLRQQIFPDVASEKIILVCASGNITELSGFATIAVKLQRIFTDCIVKILSPIQPKFCSSQQWIFHYPGIECIAAADIVIGSGGYNTVNECLALSTPLVAFSLPRMYDRQDKRAKQVYHVGSMEQAINTIRQLLNQIPSPSSGKPYNNGVVEAVDIINEL